jgi:hypothetical protein
MEKKLITICAILLFSILASAQITDDFDLLIRNGNDDSCSFITDIEKFDMLSTPTRFILSNYCSTIPNTYNNQGEILVFDKDDPLDQFQIFPFDLTQLSYFQGKHNKLRNFGDKLYSFARVCVNRETLDFFPLAIEIKVFDLIDGSFSSILLDSAYLSSDLSFSVIDERDSHNDVFIIYYVIDGEIASAKFSNGEIISRQRHGLRPSNAEIINCQAIRMQQKDILLIQWRDLINNIYQANYHEIINDGSVDPNIISTHQDYFAPNWLHLYKVKVIDDYLIRHNNDRLLVYDSNLNILLNHRFIQSPNSGTIKLIEAEGNLIKAYCQKAQSPRTLDLYEINLMNQTVFKKDSFQVADQQTLYSLNNSSLIRLSADRLLLISLCRPMTSQLPSLSFYFISLVDNNLGLISQEKFHYSNFDSLFMSFDLFEHGLIGNRMFGYFIRYNEGYLGYYYAYMLSESLSVFESVVVSVNITLHPNPATSKLHITSENNVLRQYQITDLQGRKMQSAVLPAPAATHEIDISQLAAGVYLLKVESEKGALVRRFVKE